MITGFRRFAFVMVWIALLAADHVVAATTPQLDRQISTLIGQGRISEARKLLETANPTEAERLFVEGRIRKASRDLAGAEAAFREALRRDPDYLSARRELAHTLLLAGKNDTAEFHFRELLRTDPDRRLHPGYRRFLAIIDRNKPFGLAGQFAILPSTNLNRGTQEQQLSDGGVISEESRAVSGIGFTAGLSGYYRFNLSDRSRVVLRFSGSANLYEQGEFDRATARTSVAYVTVDGRNRYEVAPFLRYTWYEDDRDFSGWGSQFSVERRLTRRMTGALSFGFEDRTFRERDQSNGFLGWLSVAASYQLTPARRVTIGVRLQRSVPRLDYLNHEDAAVFGSVSQNWRGGLTTSFGVQVGSRTFAENFGLFDFPRADDYYTINASATHSRIQLRGFSPRLNCSFTNQSSTIEFYDYTATECQLALTREF